MDAARRDAMTALLGVVFLAGCNRRGLDDRVDPDHLPPGLGAEDLESVFLGTDPFTTPPGDPLHYTVSVAIEQVDEDGEELRSVTESELFADGDSRVDLRRRFTTASTRYDGQVNSVSRTITDRRGGTWVTLTRDMRETDDRRMVVRGYPEDGAEAHVSSRWVDRYYAPLFEDGAGTDGMAMVDERGADLALRDLSQGEEVEDELTGVFRMPYAELVLDARESVAVDPATGSVEPTDDARGNAIRYDVEEIVLRDDAVSVDGEAVVHEDGVVSALTVAADIGHLADAHESVTLQWEIDGWWGPSVGETLPGDPAWTDAVLGDVPFDCTISADYLALEHTGSEPIRGPFEVRVVGESSDDGSRDAPPPFVPAIDDLALDDSEAIANEPLVLDPGDTLYLYRGGRYVGAWENYAVNDPEDLDEHDPDGYVGPINDLLRFDGDHTGIVVRRLSPAALLSALHSSADDQARVEYYERHSDAWEHDEGELYTRVLLFEPDPTVDPDFRPGDG